MISCQWPAGQCPCRSIRRCDLINYGSSEVAGTTQIVLGAGLRSNLTKEFSVGVAYEVGTSTHVGILTAV